MKIRTLSLISILLVTVACSKDRDSDRPATPVDPATTPVDPATTPVDPATTPVQPVSDGITDETPFVAFSDKSLVECQTNDLYARNCRLKGGVQKIVLATFEKTAPAPEVEVYCSAGRSNNVFGFRLFMSIDPFPVTIGCRAGEEVQRFVMQGSGRLELFVDNPALLKAMRISKNFVLEVRSIDGQPFTLNP